MWVPTGRPCAPSPWPPSWKEGGRIKKKGGLWRHILHTSCQRGCAPLDAPFGAHGTSSTVGVLLVGTHRQSPVRAHHLPSPLPERNGEELRRRVVYGGTSSDSCQRGCAPLDAPFGARGTPSDSCQGAAPLWTPPSAHAGHPPPAKGAAPHSPPSAHAGHPLTPAKELRPSGLPACTRWGTPRPPAHLAATAPGCARLAGCPTSSWRMRPASTQAAMTP